MASIILLTTPNILPGLIVAIFICIINFFVFLLLISNKKLPFGQRFLKFPEKKPKLILNDLQPAFSDWDGFISEYEDIIKTYKANYEKLTGIELENSEIEEEENREMKPYYVMNDYSEMLPKKQTGKDTFEYSLNNDPKKELEESKLGASNVFVGGAGTPINKSVQESRNIEKADSEKNLFANKDLMHFFGLQNNKNFKNTDEVQLANKRKTANFVPIFAPGFEDVQRIPDSELKIGQRNSAEFNQSLKNEQKNWNEIGQSVDPTQNEWKPFMVGNFHRKSMNLNEEEEREEETSGPLVVSNVGFSVKIDKNMANQSRESK